jgi:hypothetical protein
MQARARLGFLPALLPAAPPAVTPTRALDKLEQLACHAASKELLELPLLPQLAALCVRHALGQDLNAALSLVDMLPEPELSDRPLCDAEAFVLERYARCMPVPELKYLSGSLLWFSSAGGGSAAARPAAPQLLEHLLLPPFLAAADIRSETAAEALAACMPVDTPGQKSIEVLEDLAGGVTFMSLLAPEQVRMALQCIFHCTCATVSRNEQLQSAIFSFAANTQVLDDERLQMLPLPALPDILLATTRPAGSDALAQALAACRARRLAVSHLELHMDWSLLDARTCSAASAASTARRALATQLRPQLRPLRAALPGPLSWSVVVTLLAGNALSLPPEIRDLQHEVPPRAMQALLESSRAAAGSQPGNATGSANGRAGQHDQQARRHAPIQTVRARAPERGLQPLAAIGVFAARKRKRAPREQHAAGGEAAFFAGLQGAPQGAAGAAGAAVAADSAEGSEGNEDSLLQDAEAALPQLEVMEVELPSAHVTLLDALEADHSTAATACSAAFPRVAASGLLDVHALTPGLGAAGSAGGPGEVQRQARRALASAAALRQAASFLVHHGVRCAHLHLHHALQDAPELAPRCSRASAALSHALAQVEAGRLEDHPKQAALRRVLQGAQATRPVRTPFSVQQH